MKKGFFLKKCSQPALEVIGKPGEPGFANLSMVLNMKLGLLLVGVKSSGKYFVLASLIKLQLSTKNLICSYHTESFDFFHCLPALPILYMLQNLSVIQGVIVDGLHMNKCFREQYYLKQLHTYH